MSDRAAPSIPRVRGLLLDLDGVLHVGWNVIPGAIAVLAMLRQRGIPFLLLTNTTTLSRTSLGSRLRQIGLPVADGDLLTAPMATAAYLAKRLPGARCYLIAKGDVESDFRDAGIDLIPDDGDAVADVVVIGGAEERLTYERMNRAFRLLLGGARLVTMHRNTAWRTAEGMSLDSGPYVRALEHATGARATVIGKPAAAFFRQGLRRLALPPGAVTMVGDDGEHDLRPARRLGMATILVRTGKPVSAVAMGYADLTLDSVADLPAALGLGRSLGETVR